MRIISYSLMWDKLKKPVHTTFRFPRKDTDRGRDWRLGEEVQEYYRSRSPERQLIQIADIIDKQPKRLIDITDKEAIEDGFDNREQMWDWLNEKDLFRVINKLTLKVQTNKPFGQNEEE